MKPVVDRLREEYKGRVDIRVLNVSTDRVAGEQADAFGIRAVPTFVFAGADGTERDRWLGGMTEEQFRDRLDALLR